ncbi:MAG TPA: hypothetical protein VHA33_04905 [Candidatus Angelobacter sp.]|jgi:hypothetical protein|nr:hypothetical protein [Candidatus Angelobacter sp.]
MQEPLLHSVTRLLRYQRVPEAATARFRTWKHDADILPKLQQQLEMFLAAHGKFREVIYNTQGILDDGSDMVIRVPPLENDTSPRLICFQAKSFNDLAKDSYMQELKAQRDDTLRKVHGLEYYFLLLCTDMTEHKHKKKVRNIMAEFRSAALTEVIEPAYAYTFLHHPLTRIDAFVKRTVEEEDIVFKDAMLELENLASPSAKALTIYLAVKATTTGELEFQQDGLLSSSRLHGIYGNLREKQASLLEDIAEIQPSQPDDDSNYWEEQEQPIKIAEFDDQLSADLDNMEAGVVEAVTGTQAFRFLPDQTRAINAVITDALARYEYGEDQLMEYMLDVMGVRD